MSKHAITGLIVLSLSLLLAACGPAAEATPQPEPTFESSIPTAMPVAQTDPALLGAEWKLVSYGPIAATIPAVPETTVTLLFNQDGTMGGAGGCNGYGGNYSVTGDSIRFTEVISTMMACEEDVMAQESALLIGFEAATSYQISGDMLAIVYGGSNALIFSSGEVPAPEAVDAGESAWTLTITSPVEGAVIDLAQPVTITGTGQGLFEGALVVEVLDEGGNSVAFEPTILQGEDVGAGGFGEWSVTLTIAAPAGTNGQIRAFATSPEDGRVMVESIVPVSFN